MARYVLHLGLALGATVALAYGLAMLSACYEVPTPACGFRCGPDGECPDDYTCSAFEDRCHLNGTDPEIRCDTIDDEPDDAPFDSDGPIIPDEDALIDAGLDAATDATDAPVD